MQAITTKYLPAGNRSSRILAKCEAGRIIIPYDYDDNPHHKAVIALCNKLKWGGRLVCGGLPDQSGNVYVFDPSVRDNGKLEIID